MTITSQIETITPAIAQEWLDNKRKLDNRPISQAVVNSYADTMKNGNWLVNGEAITFDEKGNLLNGHHRLKAVIASATAIESFVVRGVDHRVFTTFDCGRNRTFGQLVTMQGEKNGNNVAAIVRTYFVFAKEHSINNSGAYSMDHTLHETNKSFMDFFLKNRKFFTEMTDKALSICGKARVLKTSFVGGSICYLIKNCGYSEEQVLSFFSQLCNAETAENKIINTLRVRLFNERNDKKNKFLSQKHAALTIKCWNAVVTGNNTIKRFNWNNEKEGFPQYLKADEI